jgi:hypothetical protein
MSTMLSAGCTCCLMMNNTPVACSCVTTPATTAKTPAKK